jgi:hypothetical protein
VVDLSGGVTAVARLCAVTLRPVYSWVEEWRVERVIDALRLMRACRFPIERHAEDAITAETIPLPKSPPASDHANSDLQ